MDGFSTLPLPECLPPLAQLGAQHTLASPISCNGTGLHSGAPVCVRLVPAPAGSGIVFVRSDLGVAVPAQFDRVAETRLCTVLEQDGARVGTVEHLMAAFSGAGIDNVVVEVDGPELPILDGSAEPWLFLIGCAGVCSQHMPRGAIEVLRTVRVEAGKAFAELRPRSYGQVGFDLTLSIEFAAAAIGRQAFSVSLQPESFARDLARARTFTERHEIEGLQAAGLARGGSLDNAIVVDGARVLNPAGLRMTDEFVRHKLLDVVGDLALAGAPLQGRFVGSRTGHALNNRLLHALFADAGNWRMAGAAGLLLAA